METAKRQAQLLHLYLLELKNTLRKMDVLNVLQRNPYTRSKAAKPVLQEVSESMQHCLNTQLVFPASVSRLQLSDEAGLKGVRGVSQILFDFQDEVLWQGILHQLLLKEETPQHRLQRFLTVNKHLLHKALELPDQTRYEKQPWQLPGLILSWLFMLFSYIRSLYEILSLYGIGISMKKGFLYASV